MGCGMSSPSSRRAYKRAHSKTKEYDVFIETIPQRFEPGDRRHAQYPQGPSDENFRWPTNRRGAPTDVAEFSGRDTQKRLHASSGKARKAFVVRRVTEHDKNHELGKQVERDESENPVEGGMELPMGSRYKGQVAGWEPYRRAAGVEFRGGRVFEPVEAEKQDGGQQDGNQ